MLILNSFFFEGKDPRFTRLKPGLALRLLSKGLFYIRAMPSKMMTFAPYIGTILSSRLWVTKL
jgi:hypothetical protein